MLADILNIIARRKLNLEKVDTNLSKQGKFRIHLRILVRDDDELDSLIEELKVTPDVYSINKVS